MRLQTLKLSDAVVHVHHVIAGLQLAEVAEKSRGLGPRARTLVAGSGLEEIARAVECQMRLRNDKSLRQRSAQQNRRRRAPRRDVLHEPRARDALLHFAQPIRHFVLAAKIGQPLEFARAGRRRSAPLRPRSAAREPRPKTPGSVRDSASSAAR